MEDLEAGGSEVKQGEEETEPVFEQPQEADAYDEEFNPFVNRTLEMRWWEVLKCIIMCLTMIPLIRLLLIALTLILTALYLKLIVCFRSRADVKGDKPLSGVMLFFLKPVNWAMRFVLLLCGVWWVTEKYPKGANCCGLGFLSGQDAPRVLVPTHCSFLEGLYFGSRLLPVTVAKAGLAKVPLVGPAFAAINPILVPRTPKERETLPDVKTAIIDKATANPRYAPLLIFPEGTTVSQDSVIKFQRGAFLPKVPVTPVVITYPYCSFDVSWTPDTGVGLLLFRMLCSVYVSMKVEYLDPYVPSSEEVEDLDLFAKGVQKCIAQHSGRHICTVSNYDGFLFGAAHGRSKSFGSYAFQHLIRSVETQEAMRSSRHHHTELVKIARLFKQADQTNSGQLSMDQFRTLFDESDNERLPEIMFRVLDKDGDSMINWREILAGIGSRMAELPPEDLYNLSFELYDVNNNGSVSREELKRVMLSTLDAVQEEDVDRKLHDVLLQYDHNGDGKIEREDFFKLAQDRPMFVKAAIHALFHTFGVSPPRGSSPVALSPRVDDEEVKEDPPTLVDALQPRDQQGVAPITPRETDLAVSRGDVTLAPVPVPATSAIAPEEQSLAVVDTENESEVP